MEERWKEIPGTNYSVSTKGNLRNDKFGTPKIPGKSKGYLSASLYTNGIRETRKVHRLVAEAFIPNPDNKPQINHKDGNPLNNSVDNLEWATGSENMIHAFRTGLAKPHPSYGMLGKKNPNGGVKGKPIRCIETGEEFKSMADAERKTGIPDSSISDCLHGIQKKTHGLRFEYI